MFCILFCTTNFCEHYLVVLQCDIFGHIQNPEPTTSSFFHVQNTFNGSYPPYCSIYMQVQHFAMLNQHQNHILESVQLVNLPRFLENLITVYSASCNHILIELSCQVQHIDDWIIHKMVARRALHRTPENKMIHTKIQTSFSKIWRLFFAEMHKNKARKHGNFKKSRQELLNQPKSVSIILQHLQGSYKKVAFSKCLLQCFACQLHSLVCLHASQTVTNWLFPMVLYMIIRFYKNLGKFTSQTDP